MRSPAEIAFRLRQELANASLALLQPKTGGIEIPTPLPGLPDPVLVARQLRDTPYPRSVLEVAREILGGQVPALGLTLTLGERIHWRRDYVSGIETPGLYFRRIPYLDPAQAGDHKVIWELNRHQHLVLLAQANLIDPQPEYAAEIRRQLESWMSDNPFQRGINWTSALEVAFRALSWIWIYHFAAEQWDPVFRRRVVSALVQHGLHLEYNLSFYFSPNTHLLGEALALYALGRLMPELPRAKRWEEAGAGVVHAEMFRQVLDDGAHFEQSAYYHVYATDMFLFFAILRKPGADYVRRLELMAEYLNNIMGASRILPLFGDDDGGRLFHPYGPRSEFGRGTLAACGALLNRPKWLGAPEDRCPIAAWWLGSQVLGAADAAGKSFTSKAFRQTGMISLCAGEIQVLLDCGGFGPGSAGHSHSDALSLLIRRGEEEILIDPGTYTYVGDSNWRNRFRGSAFHNTLTIDGQDQATPVTAFSWRGRPVATLISFEETAAEGECLYSRFRHRRKVLIDDSFQVTVIDEISGPPGGHVVEWFWHFGISAEEARAVIRLDDRLAGCWEEGGEYGWRSLAFGQREPAPVLRAAVTTDLPIRVETRFVLA